MPYLMWDNGRVELQPGSNTLGGQGEGVVPLPAFGTQAPAAVLVVRTDALSVVRRLAPDIGIRVDGRMLGDEPLPVRHGTRIDIGDLRLTYVNPVAARPKRVGDTTELHAAFTPLVPPTEGAWQLVEVRTGRVIPLGSDGAVIGRDPDCDVVVNGKGVSRRHAVIQPVTGGFEVTDQSANGTQLNGSRLVGRHELRAGDVIRISSEEYRVHLGAIPQLSRRTADATQIMSAIPENAAPPAAALEPRSKPHTALATLLITGGPLGRAEHRIERPVCAVGRGEDNDLQLEHESVSTSHATILRKGGAWFVIDLGSSSGTFVDGYRVAGERVLSTGCVLTFGQIKCSFRPRAAQSVTPRAMRRLPSESLLHRIVMLFRRVGRPDR